MIADIAAKQDRTTGDYSPFWDGRNHMNDVAGLKAAVLLAHGNNDWNVMTLSFDLQPKDFVVAAGRRLGVMNISSDRD